MFTMNIPTSTLTPQKIVIFFVFLSILYLMYKSQYLLRIYLQELLNFRVLTLVRRHRTLIFNISKIRLNRNTHTHTQYTNRFAHPVKRRTQLEARKKHRLVKVFEEVIILIFFNISFPNSGRGHRLRVDSAHFENNQPVRYTRAIDN